MKKIKMKRVNDRIIVPGSTGWIECSHTVNQSELGLAALLPGSDVTDLYDLDDFEHVDFGYTIAKITKRNPKILSALRYNHMMLLVTPFSYDVVFTQLCDYLQSISTDPFAIDDPEQRSSFRKYIKTSMRWLLAGSAAVFMDNAIDEIIMIRQLIRMNTERVQDPEYVELLSERLSMLSFLVANCDGSVRKVMATPFAQATNIRYIIPDSEITLLIMRDEFRLTKYVIDGFYMMTPFADLTGIEDPREESLNKLKDAISEYNDTVSDGDDAKIKRQKKNNAKLKDNHKEEKSK